MNFRLNRIADKKMDLFTIFNFSFIDENRNILWNLRFKADFDTKRIL